MIEKRKVLMEKVDIVKNVGDLLTMSATIENFSWCRNEMGLAALFNWTIVLYILHTTKKTTSGRMLDWYIIYRTSRSSLTEIRFDWCLNQVEGRQVDKLMELVRIWMTRIESTDGSVWLMESTKKVDWCINRGYQWIVKDRPTSTKQIVDAVKDNYSVKDRYGF